jgi:hypothetical protein
MNKGIGIAKGKWLMFLNSGDYLLSPDVLQIVMSQVTQNPADIYYGNIVIEEEAGHPYSKKLDMPLTLEFLEKATINHQASLINRGLFAELGQYNERFSMAADYAFYLKSFVQGKKFQYLDLDMVYYELNGMSMLHWDEYALQMNEIYNCFVPPFLRAMHQENKSYKNTMRYGIMKIAEKINAGYQSFMRTFSK